MAELSLGAKQRLFMKLLGKLIEEVDRRGHAVTLGWGWRPPECADHLAAVGKGIRSSLHESRLAIDLNLFIGGVYQTRTESWKPLGEFWESLHPLCRWGGRFKRADGNHFSVTHGGRS